MAETKVSAGEHAGFKAKVSEAFDVSFQKGKNCSSTCAPIFVRILNR